MNNQIIFYLCFISLINKCNNTYSTKWKSLLYEMFDNAILKHRHGGIWCSCGREGRLLWCFIMHICVGDHSVVVLTLLMSHRLSVPIVHPHCVCASLTLPVMTILVLCLYSWQSRRHSLSILWPISRALWLSRLPGRCPLGMQSIQPNWHEM